MGAGAAEPYGCLGIAPIFTSVSAHARVMMSQFPLRNSSRTAGRQNVSHSTRTIPSTSIMCGAMIGDSTATNLAMFCAWKGLKPLRRALPQRDFIHDDGEMQSALPRVNEPNTPTRA